MATVTAGRLLAIRNGYNYQAVAREVSNHMLEVCCQFILTLCRKPEHPSPPDLVQCNTFLHLNLTRMIMLLHQIIVTSESTYVICSTGL